MSKRKILVVDNDKDMCLLSNHFLVKHGYEAICIHGGSEAMEWLKNNKADLVLCSYNLEEMTGVDLLKNIKDGFPAVPVIITSRCSDIKEAVQAIRTGAFDYISKPFLTAETLLIIQKALEVPESNMQHIPTKQPQTGVAIQNAVNTATVANAYQYISGNSSKFAHVITQMELVAPTDYSVIIYGETGSGKEMIAQQIHEKSKRSGKPFIAIDCGALSKELAGSELFGHEKGAFTGAINQKPGSLELANGGTLFLDEISNLSYSIQVALLRVVQERKIKRLGGIKDISINVRIIVASNENLRDATQNGKFREDLYHRLNEFSIELPALRNRKEDIILYATHFLQLTNKELGKQVKGFKKEVADIFNSYPWHGNLRELKNVIKRATLLTNGDMMEAISLPAEINNYEKQFVRNTRNNNERQLENLYQYA